MKAWVITITSLEAAKHVKNSTVVISLISARRNIQFIKQYVENIYFILYMNLEIQKEASKYANPQIPIRSNSYADHVVYCVSHPYYFIAELSEIIDIREQDGVYWLKWKGLKYTPVREDRKTHELLFLDEVNPPIKEAPQVNFQIPNLFT